MIRKVLVTIALVIALAPTQAFAFPRNVERWRPVVRRELRHHHIYAPWRERLALKIIQRESGGNPHARGGYGNQYVGLFQYSPSWTRSWKKDWRWSGAANVRIFCRGWSRHGTRRFVYRHWAATAY